MANTIRIKKRAAGGASGSPSSLAPSELAYSEVDNILSYGFGDAGGGNASSVISIAGSGAYCTLTGNQTLSGNKIFTGTVNLSGATLSGNTTFSNNLTVTGDLNVQGTTTTIDSQTLDVTDKNITLGNVTTPTDVTADGGGISLLGATTKSFNWIDSTDSWTASEHIDLVSGKEFKIAGTSVLSGSTLGSGVTGSSLTSVGTISTGVWNGTTIGRAHGGTGLTAAPSNGQLLIGNGSGYALSTLTAGSNITITEGSGTISIASAGGASVAAGDGIDVVGSTVSLDLKANGGLVIESTEACVDLGASSITGTLAIGDGGTGATSASAARTALGAQTLAADLTNLSSCQSGASAALAALTSTEVAILDGATLSTTELNYVDGVTSAIQTQIDGKQAADADLTTLSGMQAGAATALAALTSTEVGILDGATVSTVELNYVDGVTSAIQTQLDGKQASDAQLTTLAGMAAATATNLAALTSTEVAILDGATVTTTELNIIDGNTAATATTLAAADRMVINDAGTMVQVALSDLVTFMENGAVSGFEVNGGTF